MKHNTKWTLRLWLSLCLLGFVTTAVRANPYADVDWEHWQQHRANLHTHTTMSDGQLTPAEAIDRYREMGYSVLALTDHDTVGPGTNYNDPNKNDTTWPWQRFERDPAALGMVAIEGNEISQVHHTGSYFSGYGNAAVKSPEQAVEEIGQRGGLAVMFHPGRRNYPAEWYVDLFARFEHLVGIEACNCGDRYAWDLRLWDEILQTTMPDRPVWGFANDDMHRGDLIGMSWEVFLLPEHTPEQVREAMATGRFYFSMVYEAGRPAPTIQSIRVNEEAGTITIKADGSQRIYWISRGRIVARGPTFDAKKNRGAERYVRAHLRGQYGNTYTQPFALPLRKTSTDQASGDEKGKPTSTPKIKDEPKKGTGSVLPAPKANQPS